VAAKTLRAPITASYNTRVSTTNTSLGASAFAGLAIAGIAIAGSGATSSTKDSRLVNCFNETVSDPITGQKTIYCVKRPGFGTNSTPQAGSIGNAITVWTGSGAGTDVIAAFGATNSTIRNGTTSLGNITGLATGITETFVSTTPTLTVTSSDSTAWYYDAGAGTMTQITDGQFPGNNSLTLAGTFVHIDGFACILDTNGTLWASDLNSVTAWTATSFGSNNSYPDKGIGLIRYKQYILAFGKQSLQFWYNAGQTPFPFQCSTTMTVKVGCVSADAITSIADAVFWVGSTPQGGLSLFRYDGGVQKLSTAEIDALMLIAGASQITLTSIRFYGRSFVICVVGTRTLVYCIEEQSWHEWVSGTAVLWYKCAAVSIGTTMVNYAISNISTSGKVYIMNQAALQYTDDGFTYSANPQMALMDFGTKKRKFWDSLELVGDRESSSSPLSISYSDDDYETFVTWGTVDLSDARPIARRLGSSRRRAWSFSHSAATPMRLEAAEIGVRLGTS
jgi:hypothetical protein